MFDWLREAFQFLTDVRGLIQLGGTLMVCIIVFVETGLFVGFFLPGDSLLVSAGLFAAKGDLNLAALLVMVSICAVAGDQVGYVIGRTAGHALYSRPDSFFFRKKHLERAHDFYEKYGGKTIVLARFIPIVRTFAPAVAGAAEMNYRRFVTYNVFGGILWVFSMVLTGYFLGMSLPNLDLHIHWVIAIVVFLSILPGIIEVIKARRQTKSKTASPLSKSAGGTGIVKENTRIRALAFDIGQVIVRVNVARTLQALAGGSGKTPEEVRQAIAADGRLRDFQEGRLTPQEWHAHLARQAGLRLSFEAFREAWNAALDRETILPTELFERLGANHRLAVVSNTDPLHVDCMAREFIFLRHFPSRVYSCEVGTSKPAPEIYERVLSVLQTAPQNTLYIDDVPEFVEAARRAGMHVHRFENAETLLADLRARNLL